MKTIHLYQTDEFLLNPAKGMVLYTRYAPQELAEEWQAVYDKTLEYTACFNLKLSWIKLQPNRENEYEWGLIDSVLDLAKKMGKRVMLGFATISSTGGVQEGVRSLVPNWVYEAGAKYIDIDCANYKMGGKNVNRLPVWTDEIYREKYEKLVQAVAERYDGNPLIDCIINFSHGNWGEWHYFDINGLPCDKENLYVDHTGEKKGIDFYRYYVDLFPRYFKKTPLALPTNIFDEEDELEPWVKYAIDTYSYGLKREGLNTIPNCTSKMWYCSGKSAAFGEWQTAYYHYKTDGRWSDKLVDKQIIDGQLTHYNLGYYGVGALAYVKEKESQVRYWANHLGYLFKIESFAYPEAGEKTACICIRNDGVGRIYLPTQVFLAKMNEKGEVLEEVDLGIDLRTLSGGEKMSFEFVYPFQDWQNVYVRVIETYGKRNLLLQNADGKNGYYPLCEPKRYRVHFDGRKRTPQVLTNEYPSIAFLGGAWRTAFGLDAYLPTAFVDNYLPDYTVEIELKDGKRLVSFTAYGIGEILLESEFGERFSTKISETPSRYETGFQMPSGKIKVRLTSVASCWGIRFVDFIYDSVKEYS